MNHEWHPRRPKDEIVNLMALTCEEFGFLQRLRDFAWVNGGIPADEEFVLRLARSFQLSGYKFRKIWRRIENFFTIQEDCYMYEPDEDERKEKVQNIAKSRYFGKLGALKRWGKQPETIPDQISDQDSPPYSPPYPETMANYRDNNNRQIEDQLPPPTPSMEPSSGSGTADLSIPTETHQAICQRALDLGMAAPVFKVIGWIYQQFSGDHEAIVAGLVRWEGQKHAGLWGTKTRQEFELEAFRQRSTIRKETQNERLLRQSRELDEQDRRRTG